MYVVTQVGEANIVIGDNPPTTGQRQLAQGAIHKADPIVNATLTGRAGSGDEDPTVRKGGMGEDAQGFARTSKTDLKIHPTPGGVVDAGMDQERLTARGSQAPSLGDDASERGTRDTTNDDAKRRRPGQ